MAADHNKNNQKVNNNATVTNKLHKTPFFEILSGDHSFIRKIFFHMSKKGWFPYLGSKGGSEKELWVQDLSQIVALVILETAVSGDLNKIKRPEAYIKSIIRYKSIDENKRLSKCISIDSIQLEDDNEKS